jgi:hypothetical protein
MLAMVVNDNACLPVKRCAYASIASELASTVAGAANPMADCFHL